MQDTVHHKSLLQRNQYPWTVSLQETSEDGVLDHVCTGTLIASKGGC